MQAIKMHHVPVAIVSTDARASAQVSGKPAIELATAEDEGAWSSEELLVAALGSSFGRTFAGLAEHFELPVHELELDAVGQLGARHGGGVGLTSVELHARLWTESGREALARSICARSARSCPVANALAVPVGVELIIEEEGPR